MLAGQIGIEPTLTIMASCRLRPRLCAAAAEAQPPHAVARASEVATAESAGTDVAQQLKE